MHVFKKVDLWIQLILFIFAATHSLTSANLFNIATLTLMGWQVLSSLIHLICHKKYYPAHQRLRHNACLLACLVLFSLFFLTMRPSNFLLALMIAGVLLLVIPVISIWYFIICLQETRNLDFKSFVHVK